jgi:uncharacterized protein
VRAHEEEQAVSYQVANRPGDPNGPQVPRGLAPAAVGAAVVAMTLVAGLAWAKWLPYTDKATTMLGTGEWDGSAVLDAGGTAPSLSGAWTFLVTYTEAVWAALLVSLLVAAGIDALLSRRWLQRFLGSGGRWRQAGTGALASLPSMMCTCCTAPITVTLRRAGVPRPAVLAHWLGNPLLNPAVLVFLFLVGPWEWGVTRLLVGLVVVLGAGALIGALADRGTAVDSTIRTATDEAEPPATLSQLPGRFVRSLWRLSRILVPEYALVVLLVGAFSGWLSQFAEMSDGLGLFAEMSDGLGLFAVLVAAVIGALLVVPTGGEIPVLVALSAVGVGAGLLGVLLVTLPALSLPSMAMVARVLSVRATVLTAGAVVAGGLLAGVLLTVLGCCATDNVTATTSGGERRSAAGLPRTGEPALGGGPQRRERRSRRYAHGRCPARGGAGRHTRGAAARPRLGPGLRRGCDGRLRRDGARSLDRGGPDAGRGGATRGLDEGR